MSLRARRGTCEILATLGAGGLGEVSRAIRWLLSKQPLAGGRLAWMGGLEGATFAVFSPAKGVHEGVFKVQNGVFSCHLAHFWGAGGPPSSPW